MSIQGRSCATQYNQVFRGTATGLRRVRLDARGRAQRVLELGQRLLQVAQVREASPQPEVRDAEVRVLERAAARALAAAAHLLQHAGGLILSRRSAEHYQYATVSIQV